MIEPMLSVCPPLAFVTGRGLEPVIATYDYAAFGNGNVDLKGPVFDMKVLHERSETWVDIGSDPGGWYCLACTLRWMRRRRGGAPSGIEYVETVARDLEASWPRVEALFRTGSDVPELRAWTELRPCRLDYAHPVREDVPGGWRVPMVNVGDFWPEFAFLPERGFVHDFSTVSWPAGLRVSLELRGGWFAVDMHYDDLGTTARMRTQKRHWLPAGEFLRRLGLFCGEPGPPARAGDTVEIARCLRDRYDEVIDAIQRGEWHDPPA